MVQLNLSRSTTSSYSLNLAPDYCFITRLKTNKLLLTKKYSFSPGWVHCSVDPDIAGSCDGKDEKEEDEEEGLKVVSRHTLHTKQDCPEKFTLDKRILDK